MYKHHAYGLWVSITRSWTPKIHVGQSDLYLFASLILSYVLESIWCINIILMNYESVWPEDGQILHWRVSFGGYNVGTFLCLEVGIWYAIYPNLNL